MQTNLIILCRAFQVHIGSNLGSSNSAFLFFYRFLLLPFQVQNGIQIIAQILHVTDQSYRYVWAKVPCLKSNTLHVNLLQTTKK